LQVRANGTGHGGEFGQRVAQQGRFVAVARGRHERRDDVALAIAEGDDLAALQMLVSAVAEVVSAFFCRRRRAVAVDDLQIQQLILMEPAYRARKDPLDAAIGLPAPHHPVDARVVDFRQPGCIAFDRQHFPLTPHIERLQDVVEDPVQRQCGWRSAPATAEVGKDKLRFVQFRRDRLPDKV
jgi:hypothetical protein